MRNIAEILRLIHNLIRFGSIAEVNYDLVRCRVKVGDLKTGWVRWMDVRAGTTRDWNPPTVGEQVVLLSPGGELAAAVALTGLSQKEYRSPVNTPNLWRRDFPDGAVLQYNHEDHIADVTLPAAATLNLISPGGLKITGDTEVIGNFKASGSVSDGVRSMADDRAIYNDHTHNEGEIPKPDQRK